MLTVYEELKKIKNEYDSTIKEVQKPLKDIKQYVRDNNLRTHEKTNEILKYFKKIFENISPISITLLTTPIKLAAGTYGFGIRENVKAREISSFSELNRLKENEVAIYDALYNRNKFKHAKNFKTFMNIIDFEYLNKREIEIEKDLNILTISSLSSLMYCKEIILKNINLEFIRSSFNISLKYIEKNDDTKYLRNTEINTDYDKIEFNNFLLLKELESYLPEIYKKINNFLLERKNKFDTMKTELDKEFGKYFLLDKI